MGVAGVAASGEAWERRSSSGQPCPILALGRKANLGAHEPRCQGREAPY